MLSSRRWRKFVELVFVGVAVATSRLAVAQVHDPATAQALYDQAKALMQQSNYAEACPKLEESQSLDPGSGTLLNLGDCYEHLGRTASAWSTFLEAGTAAKNAGNTEREQVARDRAAALVPVLSKLEIDVPDAARIKGLAVTRDEIAVGTPLWGSATPIDPGPHHVSAIAPGRARWDLDINVGAGGDVQKVEIPVLQPEASAPASAAPEASAANLDQGQTPGPAPDTMHEQTRSGLGTKKILALVAGGVGVVGVGVGTVFGLKSKSKHDEAEQHCDGSSCRDQTGVDLKSEAITAGNVATAGFVVGILGLAGGATLWFLAGGQEQKQTAELGIGPGYASIRGRW